jgi:hypothetical protein
MKSPARPSTNNHVLFGCRKGEELSKGHQVGGAVVEGLSQDGEEKEKEEQKKEEDEREHQCQPCGEREGEQAREAVMVKTPTRVSKEEREKHELTHAPFRSWCKFCVMGRGRNNDHRLFKKGESEEMTLPRVSLDYF